MLLEDWVGDIQEVSTREQSLNFSALYTGPSMSGLRATRQVSPPTTITRSLFFPLYTRLLQTSVSFACIFSSTCISCPSSPEVKIHPFRLNLRYGLL